jgi:SP family arabinose:H+ symporter-like MFS transporter
MSSIAKGYTTRTALIVALGGFLMGFDASVISGVIGFIEVEFALTKLELGWSVASLALAATFAMMAAGPLSDRFGRRPLLGGAAVLFALSAVASAAADSFTMLVIARIVGGLGVGTALIVAPMYIAEISPARDRGRMVSINQLNIVIGISAAFFSNFLILRLGHSEAGWATALRLDEWTWRWMLGVETLPAIVYYLCLRLVPESPRWLLMHGRDQDALAVLARVGGQSWALTELQAIKHSLAAATDERSGVKTLLDKPLRLVMLIGLTVAVLQQITGINSVFFYAPMIFEQSGVGTDAAFMQAVLVGLTNLVFTLAAMALIDRLGRKPLLMFGVSGIAACMLLLAWGFDQATYTLSAASISTLPAGIDPALLANMQDVTYPSDTGFRSAAIASLGEDTFQRHQTDIISAAITIQPMLILFGIIGFVACFAISIGPVMWVLFSELFPNRIRGIAISVVGLVNSAVSFTVQLLFPWQLANLGNAMTFFIYGVFALAGVLIIAKLLPETRGKSLEELEAVLVPR